MEPDTDPTSWDSLPGILPPTPSQIPLETQQGQPAESPPIRQIPLETQPGQPAEPTPTPDRSSTPTLRRSTRECVTNHRPNYKD